jgi:hypothetical protein
MIKWVKLKKIIEVMVNQESSFAPFLYAPFIPFHQTDR